MVIIVLLGVLRGGLTPKPIIIVPINYTNMKKEILVFVIMAITCALSAHAAIDVNNPDGGEPIPIQENNSGEEEGTKLRSIVPIEVVYYSQGSFIDVSFSRNLGYVQIRLLNQTTLLADVLVDSSTGNCVIPFVGDTGLCHLSISTEDGEEYYGSFNLH